MRLLALGVELLIYNYIYREKHTSAKQLSHVITSILIVANRAVIADIGIVLFLQILDSSENTTNIYIYTYRRYHSVLLKYGIPGGTCIMSKLEKNPCEM